MTGQKPLRRFCILYLLAGLWFAVFATATGSGANPPTAKERTEVLIEKAGNANSDQVRLELLKELRKKSNLDESFRNDLDKLIGEIERWLGEKRLYYFGREVGKNKDFDFGISEESPLHPLTWLYRGRMVVWYTMENGGVWNNRERKREFLSVARDFFRRYSEAFPENRIAKMYLGTPTGPYKHYSPGVNAPKWAIYQREALEQLTDVIEWWIDNRMQEDAQFGGGWGDDCEMWRWQVPILIGFENPKISRAQERFSAAMMKQEHMKHGYTTRMSDVEHTAEDSADVITPMMHLEPENELWQQRSLYLAELMDSLWTGRNKRGLLQFKSTYFTVERVETNPQRACDTVYHPRAVQPALLYWQRTNDENLTELFSDWMDTWVDITARAERGKPAGIIPSAIHWPDGRPGGMAADWWDPRNHGEYTLYLWPSAMRMMTNTMLLTYHITGNEKYLGPIRSMARIQLKYLRNPSQKPRPGSKDWCASRMGFLTDTIAKYRFLTGSREFDQLLNRRMSPYMRFRMQNDLEGLVESLGHTAEALMINFEGYTSEVRYTDRVLRFPSLFGSDGIVSKTAKTIYSPDTSLLYSAVTGDPGSALYFPLNAVRWLTPSRNIAALVVESGTGGFQAQLYNFSGSIRRMSAELYLLAKGQYSLEITVGDSGEGEAIVKKLLTVEGPRTRIDFKLPAQRLCILKVTKQ